MVHLPLDWLHPETIYTIVCRPALSRDTADVLELTRTIWEGHDYVPSVWAEWLADPAGLLIVAEYGPRVVGLCKLTLQGPGEWWLEGLRVHPAYEGRGVASHMHDYLLDYWMRNGDGFLRLVTASFRKPVHHMCERTGFTKIGEFTPYAAEVVQGEAVELPPIRPEEAEQVADLIAHSETLALSGGLMDLGWQMALPTATRLGETIDRGLAWWWRSGQGLLLAREDEELEASTLVAQIIACSLENLPALLLDFRRLAGVLGYQRAGWFAPLGVGLEPVMENAGYLRDWDASIYAYEKRHPA
jgi:GNAT superfamily N-acetyltransferase